MRDLLSAPTVAYCEQAGGGLIQRPWYALSNVSFVIAAWLIYRTEKTRLARVFALITLTVGILSFVYDATYAYIAQLADLSGMLLFINLLLVLNMRALFPKMRWMPVAGTLGVLSMAVIVLCGGYAGNVVFGLYVAAVITTETALLCMGRHDHGRYWLITFAIFTLGFGCWIFDAARLVCFDLGLLNGRAIFHYAAAIVMYRMFLFYRKSGCQISKP